MELFKNSFEYLMKGLIGLDGIKYDECAQLSYEDNKIYATVNKRTLPLKEGIIHSLISPIQIQNDCLVFAEIMSHLNQPLEVLAKEVEDGRKWNIWMLNNVKNNKRYININVLEVLEKEGIIKIIVP